MGEKRINWSKVQALVRDEAPLKTVSGIEFYLVASNDNTVWVEVNSGNQHTISRTHLDEAIAYLNRGKKLDKPVDYKNKIADDRPSYAWAILRHLGYL